jgi:hypothetical protein
MNMFSKELSETECHQEITNNQSKLKHKFNKL